jgi:hypothetical protein
MRLPSAIAPTCRTAPDQWRDRRATRAIGGPSAPRRREPAVDLQPERCRHRSCAPQTGRGGLRAHLLDEALDRTASALLKIKQESGRDRGLLCRYPSDAALLKRHAHTFVSPTTARVERLLPGVQSGHTSDSGTCCGPKGGAECARPSASSIGRPTPLSSPRLASISRCPGTGAKSSTWAPQDP